MMTVDQEVTLYVLTEDELSTWSPPSCLALGMHDGYGAAAEVVLGRSVWGEYKGRFGLSRWLRERICC